jgi:hypothetical protein
VSYTEYKALVTELFEKDLVTGPTQVKSLLDSTKMSLQRMKKWDKIFKVSTGLQEDLAKLEDHWTWYMITEGWCGDASQIIPVVSKIADASDKIELKILFRDENSEIMDKYLTNNGKAIPILVAVNNRTGEELPHWGPRPKGIQEMILTYKKENPDFDKSEFSKTLHLWYAKDKGVMTQIDIHNLVSQFMLPAQTKLHKVG